MAKKMKEKKQQWATEYAMVNANPFLKATISALVVLIDLAIMLMIIWNVFMWFIPFGSCINFVDGRSMDPTLHHGQMVFSDMSDIERGDIITTRFPKEAILMDPGCEGLSMIKRVIAVPGDKIIIDETGVFVNDVLLNEDYLTDEAKALTYLPDSDYTALILEDREYFVMGDNRGNSNDSRYFGVVMEEDLLYKQSTELTKNFYVKLGILIALFACDIFIYMLVEFVLTELIYGLIYGRKIKKMYKTKDSITLKGDM